MSQTIALHWDGSDPVYVLHSNLKSARLRNMPALENIFRDIKVMCAIHANYYRCHQFLTSFAEVSAHNHLGLMSQVSSFWICWKEENIAADLEFLHKASGLDGKKDVAIWAGGRYLMSGRSENSNMLPQIHAACLRGGGKSTAILVMQPFKIELEGLHAAGKGDTYNLGIISNPLVCDSAMKFS